MRPLTLLMRLPARRGAALIFAGLCLGAGCVHVKMDPIEVKPITLNVNLKIDRQLDDFFAFEKDMGPATTQASTAPTTQATAR